MSAKPPPPSGIATLEIERPVAAVRAQFFDVDHHVRDKIYRGVRLRWAPPKVRGERRVRQGVKVLDRIHVEEFVIEEGDDASWVKRFVDGANAGTQFVANFFPQGDTTTLVQLHAFVGPNGFATGLGKLSPLGLDKALQKVLLDHKRAIEGYEEGHARGAVLDVIKSWADLTAKVSALDDKRRRGVIGAVLEAASTMAVADDEADPAERDAMNAAASALFGYVIAPDVETRMVEHAAEASTTEGVEARCDRLGAKLKAMGFAELGLSVAVLVADVSGGLDIRELAALRRLASAAGFDDTYLARLIDRVDMALSGDRASRISVFM